jgi:hypothetical protein
MRIKKKFYWNFLIIFLIITNLISCSSFDIERFSLRPKPVIDYDHLRLITRETPELKYQNIINSLDGAILEFNYKTYFLQ